jgi:uncharacterized membrane protein YdbT with pleckstrin-like domain
MTDVYIKRLLGDNERIILSSRQHWFIVVGAVFVEVVFILAILIGVTILLLNYSEYPIIALGFILLVFPVVSMFKDVLEWQSRQYIVTNRRVLQTSGVFNKSVIDSSLDKVNDVKMVQSFFGRIFDFGDIEILTASELGVNLFKRINDPILFKTTMMNAKEQMNDESSPIQVSTGVPAMIEQMDQLRRRGIITDAEFQEKKRELLSKL